MEGVEDIPGTALAEGITWGWESFPEYLDVLEGIPHAVDVAAQLPHAALRGYVMGDRGADHLEVPTTDEIATMAGSPARASRAGALGFTTSRTVNHRSSDGRPTPSLTATADELLGIARGLGATGHGRAAAGGRPRRPRAGVRPDPLDGRGQRPAAVDHHAVRAPPRRLAGAAGHISAAQADGVPDPGPGGLPAGRRADGPRGPPAPAGDLTHLPVAWPTRRWPSGWRRLRDPEVRATVLGELPNGGLVFGGYDGIFPLGDPPEYDPGADRSIDGPRRARGTDAGRGGLRRAARARRPRPALPAVRQLRRPGLRHDPGDAPAPPHRPRPRRRRGPLRDDLRRHRCPRT